MSCANRQLVRVEVPHDGRPAGGLPQLGRAGDRAPRENAGVPFAASCSRQRGRAPSGRAALLQLSLCRARISSRSGDVARARLERARRRDLHGRVRRMATPRTSWCAKASRAPSPRRASHLLHLLAGRCWVSRADRQPALQHRQPDRGLRHRLAARAMGMKSVFLPLSRPVRGQAAQLVRLRADQGQDHHRTALRARVLSRTPSARLPSEGAMDARHRPAELEPDRLERLARVNISCFRDRKASSPRSSRCGLPDRPPARSVLLPRPYGHPGDERFPSLFAFDRAAAAARRQRVAFVLRIIQRVYFVNRLYAGSMASLGAADDRRQRHQLHGRRPALEGVPLEHLSRHAWSGTRPRIPIPPRRRSARGGAGSANCSCRGAPFRPRRSTAPSPSSARRRYRSAVSSSATASTRRRSPRRSPSRPICPASTSPRNR